MDVSKDPNVHTSVLLEELVWAITISGEKQNIIVDATLGLAGHASEILQKMNRGDILIGFDADSRNLELAKQKLKHIQILHQKEDIEIVLIHNNFASLRQELDDRGINGITGIYYDLGMSSLHFDEAERGFSLRLDGPLDMRLDTQWTLTAADILNFYEEKDLFQIFKDYGEEPHARKVAAKVIERRKKQKFSRTLELNDFLESEVNKHIKTKMRVFQALRIEVNKELEVLKTSLMSAIELLEKDGNIFVISFHSLEDRIVKHILKRETRDCICSDTLCSCHHTKSLKVLTKKPILPSKEEQQTNTRSRSAKARHAQKII